MLITTLTAGGLVALTVTIHAVGFSALFRTLVRLRAQNASGFCASSGSPWLGQLSRIVPDDSRALVDRYELKDVAIKIVGVGSVGTYCCIMLVMASEQDP